MKKTEILCRIFFPAVCPLCARKLTINEEFCTCCSSAEVKLSDNCCESCGKEADLCSCDKNNCSVILSHITGVFAYDGIIRNMLIFHKFGHRKDLYKFFGDRLAERVATAYADTDFDAVTFVPTSAESLKEKGYNPAELIAKRTARKLFLPCQELLVKEKDTEKQHKLKGKERLANIKGSLAVKSGADVKGKTVLICDDIKTTGATLRECEDMLMKAGAKEVFCAAVAITSNLNYFDLDKEDKNK